jgi:hypothetical protein
VIKFRSSGTKIRRTSHQQEIDLPLALSSISVTMISVYNMASSSRAAIRTTALSLRQPVIPVSAVFARRLYATESESRPSAAPVPTPEFSLSGSASRSTGQTTMKKYTGPGFPKIPVSYRPQFGSGKADTIGSAPSRPSPSPPSSRRRSRTRPHNTSSA